MTTRIERRFANLKKEGRAALVTFTMAGDPDYATALAIAKELPRAGADVIELGMPFTDPMADGPAIQAADCGRLRRVSTSAIRSSWWANFARAMTKPPSYLWATTTPSI